MFWLNIPDTSRRGRLFSNRGANHAWGVVLSVRLKHDWLFKTPPPTRSQMKQDVAACMKYHNVEGLHLVSDNKIPVEYEKLAN